MPESPHFLISKGREDDARKALEKVRFDDQIDWEIEGKLTSLWRTCLRYPIS